MAFLCCFFSYNNLFYSSPESNNTRDFCSVEGGGMKINTERRQLFKKEEKKGDEEDEEEASRCVF